MFSQFLKGFKSLLSNFDTGTLIRWLVLIFKLLRVRKDNTMAIDADEVLKLIGRNAITHPIKLGKNESSFTGVMDGAFEHVDSSALFEMADEMLSIVKERDDNTMFHDADRASLLISQNQVNG